MNTLALLIGLGPLIGWGFFPTIASKFGGRPSNQILGTTLGTLLFAIVFNFVQNIALPAGHDLIFAILSGVGWASAQILTFYCFTLIGSSRVMPITTAFQLLGASLWGVIALDNWPTAMDKLIGVLALILIILGAWMTVWSEHQTNEHQAHLKKAVFILAIGEIGYWAYSAAPQATNLTGMQAFLPQAIGMVIVAIIYDFYHHFKSKEPLALVQVVSYKQIFSGFFFAFAALTYLISAQPDMNGLATGFILSQTSVVLATLTGIYFLKQSKTKKEMTVTILGLILIIFAASLTVIV
ncbi:MAG TPA: GRP family sugar transporter [Enterococcus columbae]|nr:GRP family sugar transporter [Enterococcus columbae]